MKMRNLLSFVLVVGFGCSIASAQASTPATTKALTKPAKVTIDKLTNQPDEWFKGEGKTTVDNVVTWQNLNGGWWKAYDFNKPNPEAKKEKRSGHDSGFDNGATYSELRILARAYRVTQNAAYKDSFD